MASGAVSFDSFFGEDAERNRPQRAPIRRDPWWSFESWITLSIVILVQLPVVGSLQSADWVREMPSLMVPATAAVAVAWALGNSRIPGLIAALVGVIVASVATTALVLHTMTLADPFASGLGDRWYEFRLRLLEWGRALIDLGISTDPLPFVVLLTASVFLVTFVSTWAVVRWRNPWLALVPGGFVLLTNISYLPGQPAFSFVFFVLAAVLLVARLTYLQALDRWRQAGVTPAEGTSYEVLLAGGVVALVLVAAAWVIPTANNWGPVADAWTRALAPVNERVDRFGQLFVGVGSKKPIPVHAFGPALPLQGEVFLNSHVLFEVIADQEVSLRGAVYDEYTAQGWRVSSVAPMDLLGTTVEAAALGTPATRAELRQPVRVEVTVLNDAAPTAALLTPGDPITTDAEARITLDSAGRPLALQPRQPAVPGTTYSTVGTVSVAAIGTLLEAGTNYPATIAQRYTALPDGLPPEVASLAASVTAGAQTPYEAARLVETYLRQNYRFNLAIDGTPPGRDAVSHFLFESQEGYFDQFSSAMAIMLRTLDIPTRVSAGFILDARDLDAETKTYQVTEERAWSWPEVYFPGLGWVEFNPTPSRAVVTRPGDDDAARAAAAAALGAGGFADDEFDALFEEQLLDLIEADFGSTDALGLTAMDEPDPVREFIGRAIGWSIIGSAILLAAVVALRFLWERFFKGLTPPQRRWAKLQRYAHWAGIGMLDDRTPTESADDLAQRIASGDAGMREEMRSALRALARSYVHARYSAASHADEPVEEVEEVAEALDAQYALVRRRLRGLVTGRILRFGRVPDGPLARRNLATRSRR